MTADKTTVSRPYAKAAFEDGRASGSLEQWSRGLAIAAEVVSDPRVAPLLDDPQVEPAELAQLVTGIAGPQLGDVGRNFLLMLAENGRLAYLPEISARLDDLKDEAEGVADVTITSATPLDEAQRGRLSEALARRLKRQVRLHCETDPGLIGGAVVRAGDLVIDGSLRTRLER
ncbi:MAG: F0F1 ATP synthase subunit delta, partial [Steroidobacteraceae bacterium]